ncbi:hypothetical protein MGALJ_28190 [Mycobacterium gallinarum]|uniref:Uncharacterized protein n=1 Tax=Mycobacterium gallinarum TaxID=39689 RepID=A0A9W4B3B4_9MYCO|nr:hypothetical protein MGALJ_28190 [Mycobacterium gallinarum]
MAGVAAGADGADGAGAPAGGGVLTGGGPGVLEAVESLDPHPAIADATATVTKQILTADFTLRTVPKPSSAIGQAARRVGHVTGTRLID